MMRESFMHRENTKLTDELLTELPGILAWSLDGLDRLTSQGCFTQPASSVDALTTLQDLASPVGAFIRDECLRDPNASVTVHGVWKRWRAWSEDNGHSPGTIQTLGRNLRAVLPELRQTRPRSGDSRTRRYVGIMLRDG
jgi:putative DNA primase/helicase